MEEDWICVASVENMFNFLKNNLKLDVLEVEKRYNNSYGTYFVAEINGFCEEFALFGKYGKLKIIEENNKKILQEDFEFSKNNLLFMQEYLSFVNNLNKQKGKVKKVNGKTYLNSFNELFECFNEREKE